MSAVHAKAAATRENAPVPRRELFPFRYRDKLIGKWICARYVAQRHGIAERYAEWEIIGPPEIREWREDERYFNPFRYEGEAPIGSVESIMDFAGMVLRRGDGLRLSASPSSSQCAFPTEATAQIRRSYRREGTDYGKTDGAG